MYVDQLGIPLFSDADVLEVLYSGRLDLLESMSMIDSDEIDMLEARMSTRLTRYQDIELTQVEFDALNQQQWFMPEEYKDFDIKRWLLTQCTSQQQLDRVNEEFNEFEHRGMVPLLQWLKYFVDVCESKQILRGVGRGSSVSSYVLYLIGTHRIDPLKFQLDWKEFLR